MTHYALIVRRAMLRNGHRLDIGIADGRIAAMAERLEGRGPELDARGGAIMPGLIDHHIHLLATAARLASTDLSGIADPQQIIERLRASAARLKPGTWLRATGWDEGDAPLPDRHVLDSWVVDQPIRIQDRTGALWLLNSAAIEQLGSGPYPECVECDSHGTPNGRIWRGDAWLRDRIGSDAPDLGPLSKQLAACGITGVTDTGANNDNELLAELSRQHRSGALLQNVMAMGREGLSPHPGIAIGPLKLLYDESALPDPDSVAMRIRSAHGEGRAVAAHCVTATELAFFLAALNAAGGARPGDRIEHGGMIPEAMIPVIAEAGLTVVTQPAFIHDRGERYIERIAGEDIADLYRLASLCKAGIAMAAGSDAPYGSADPWLAIRAARDRLTSGGRSIGPDEAMDSGNALDLYLHPFDMAPGTRRIEVGAPASLCIARTGWDDLLAEPSADHVAATLVDGKIVHKAIQ
ncbi:MAG: amidohydrolase family protein [Blastomonas sp.]